MNDDILREHLSALTKLTMTMNANLVAVEVTLDTIVATLAKGDPSLSNLISNNLKIMADFQEKNLIENETEQPYIEQFKARISEVQSMLNYVVGNKN